jgi:hypothetical protein
MPFAFLCGAVLPYRVIAVFQNLARTDQKQHFFSNAAHGEQPRPQHASGRVAPV